MELEFCVLILGCLFSFLQKVSGQQTLYECIKNDFFSRFVFHIHALRRNQVQRCKHGSQNDYHQFFFERDSFILSFFIVHPLFSEKLNKVEI